MVKSRCDWCKQIRELEDWGCYKVCKRCADIVEGKWGKPPKTEMSDVTMGKPTLDSQASYNPGTGKTKLRSCLEEDLFESINHEFIHFLLHKMSGLRCCYQFDNVEKVVDSYHSLQ